MINILRKLLLPELFRHLPSEVKNHLNYCLWDGFSAPYYSQEGEDAILNRIFDSRKTGFYVDIGAHHPRRFSNTYYFYRRGWRGINIDAMPGSMKPFHAERSRDINLQVGVGKVPGELTFYIFEDAALNTFDAGIANYREKDGAGVPCKTTVPVRPLAKILGEYLPAGTEVDFMSVDVEGLDLEVLESNDWRKFRPLVVLAEIFECTAAAALKHPISMFLTEQGYEMVSKTLNTVFYRMKS